MDVAVTVEVWDEPLTLTGVGDAAQVTGLVAPVGIVVALQVSATDPMNPFTGLTVTVDVLPEVAAWRKLRLVGLAVNVNDGTATATLTVVV